MSHFKYIQNICINTHTEKNICLSSSQSFNIDVRTHSGALLAETFNLIQEILTQTVGKINVAKDMKQKKNIYM